MSDLVDSEAEESLDESLSSEEEEEEEHNEGRSLSGNLADLINDEEEESAASEDEKSESAKSDDEDDGESSLKRKRSKDEELDEEDLDLIQENLGIRLPKKKFHRLKKVKAFDSDEDEEAESAEPIRERQFIEHQLFELGDREEGDEGVATPEPAPPPIDSTYADIDESESEEDEFDNFIVDDEGKPIKHHHQKRKVMVGGHHDSALQEAQDTFGLAFDFDEFEKFGHDDFDEDEEDYEEEDDERVALKKARRKASKKSIYEVFEPSELEKGMLTDKDAEIKTSDIPERFQVRDVPVEQAEEQELEEEAEWIFKYAFLEQPISHQDVDEQGIPSIDTKQTKPHSTISKIQEALNLMRNQLFEVPFIANYRKEYIEPELNTEDLWKIWEFDEKWTQLRTRKQNLHRLFEQMQDYQFSKVESEREQPLSEETRILQPEDIDRLDAVQTIDQLKDVYSHFMLYYGNDIPTMQEEQRKKALEEKSAREGAEAEEKDDLPKVEPPKLKKPRKRDLYTICHEAGLSGLAKKFGLTPDQFGENLRDNYQRHETEQHPMDPGEAAESYLNSLFPTTDQVLEGARHMVAMQIAKDPLVRQCVREVYGERAKITVTPTKKGKKEIDESHPCFPFKYLKNKPVRDLRGDQYLKLSLAEDEGMLTISLSMDFDNRPGYQTYFDEVKQLYHRDEFSLLVQEWNAQRYQALTRAFTKMLYPFFEKELKTKLLLEAKQFVIKCCQKRLRSWIDVAPYQPEQQHEDNSYDEDTIGGDGLRVLACSFLPDPTVPSFFAMLDGGGNVVDHLRLKYLLVRRNSSNTREKEMKVEDMEKLKDFVLKKRPHVIAVASTCREATSVMDDIKMCLSELEQENQMTPIGVELVDCEVARIYQSSPRSENEVREYPPVLRNALSIGRRLQDPLAEFSSLCVEEDEMLCVRFHPLQDQIDKEKLVKSLHTELVTVVNDVGVDPNRLLDHPHTVALLQFVCGLGPRKASALLKSLRQQGSRLENRSQLVTICNLGPKIFLNCAGFIKIDTAAISDISTNYIEVLDGSRVHPETYEWAKQMAVDALEYDETTEEANPSAALEEILDTPDRLKDLDLDAFAVELERQNYGNKKITLYDIRDELFGRYRERRVIYRSLSIEEVFRLLTGETSNSLYVGKLVICTVTGFAFRKPAREMIDQANPERNDQTGLWQCPFCLKNDYAELGDVWTHLDNGSCPGQAVGVRVRHDSGLSGFIPTKMISDKHVKSPQERVKVGMTLHGRVTRINMERFQIDLTCRSSDLTDKDNKFSLPKDLYYDKDSEDKDKKEEELVKKKANRPKYIKRVIVHPAFRNISFKEAEKVLSDMEQGECVVRPSSKGSDHLTVTWKVEQGIYQHIDVREEGKENAFSLGRSLWIENEEFEDLDEIIARHIQPMAALSREVVAHKYHRSAEGGVKQKLEEILIIEKKKAVQRIPYYISLSKAYPGKFLLGYMPRNKPRIEMVSITPDGFRYRNRVHGTLNGLFRWFKEHFRDPIPGYRNTPTAMSESNTPYTPGATPSVHPSSYSQWGNTTSGNSSHIPAQSTLTPTAPAYRSNQPQFGYYQTHQDSMNTAVQNYQRTQQRQGYRT